MLIVDRFEGGVAVVEKSGGSEEISFIKIQKERLGGEVKTGDVLIEQDGVYHKDEAATEKRRGEINCLLNELLTKSA